MSDRCPTVHATDGKIGELHSVVLTKDTHIVSRFIIKRGAGRQADYWLLTPDQVDHVDADGSVHLNIDKAAVKAAPKYSRQVVHGEFDADTDDKLVWGDIYGVMTTGTAEYTGDKVYQSGVDVDAMLVGYGTRVYTNLGEQEGKIECITLSTDATKPGYLVIKLKGMRGKIVVAEASHVTDWRPDAVVLDMDTEALKALPKKIPTA